MKVNIKGNIIITLNGTDIAIARKMYRKRMGQTQALIQYAREEAKAYIHDKGYLEVRTLKETGYGLVVDFNIMDTYGFNQAVRDTRPIGIPEGTMSNRKAGRPKKRGRPKTKGA